MGNDVEDDIDDKVYVCSGCGSYLTRANLVKITAIVQSGKGKKSKVKQDGSPCCREPVSYDPF